MQTSVRFRDQLIPVTGTILQSLEKSSIAIESHCRKGFCGAFRVKLKSGTVGYITDPLGFVDDDEILACCSYPTSENVEVDIQ